MKRRVIAVGVLTATTILATLSSAPPAPAAVGTDSRALRKAVTLSGVMEHQRAFQKIADRNNDTRASGTPGYDQSADYVAKRLRAAGFRVTQQFFDYPFFQETATPQLNRVSPDPVTYVHNQDFITMDYSGSGDVTSDVVPTNDILIPPPATPGSTSGCEAPDFPASVAGSIALIQRGTCTFAQKALNAQNAGAVGVIIFNEGQAGRTDAFAGTLGAPDFRIPITGTSFALGADQYQRIRSGQTVMMHMFVQSISEIRQTSNVIGETTSGRSDRVAFAGAHLDSVTEGPGINDNGSGSSTLLEIAEQLSALKVKPTNQVRFGFWGAEEAGLFGSEFYVSELSSRQIKNISAYLNFDMVGSPNFVRFVYDGDNSDTVGSNPNGSGQIEDVFLDYFASQRLETDPTEIGSRSDHAAFAAVGIPVGGLFTGAEGIKTPEQRAVYGGTAGIAYDPCYHQACDDISNLSSTALDQMSDAAAHAVLTFAMTDSAVQGTDKGNAFGLKDDHHGPKLTK
ncbi:MAG TPA: M28 family peptidase [Actinomycetota bacterium]|nr:M28 family peptidase [Actinomycetota bacterium]